MKIFIVFVGLLLVNTWAVCYQGDMGRYVQLQALLKATAEECAAGAALLLNEEAYAEGYIEFDEKAGQAYADEHLAYAVSQMGSVRVLHQTCELSFGELAVTARVKLVAEDLFRLPFLSVTNVQRESTYEFDYI